MRRSIVGVALVATVASLAACSSSGGHSRSGPAPLSSLVVQASDLPSSWGTKPSTTTSTQRSANEDAEAKCLDAKVTPSGSDIVRSRVFYSGAEEVSSAATQKPGVSEAEVTAHFKNPKVAQCLRAELVSDAKAHSLHFSQIKVDVEPGAGTGPSNVAAGIDVKFVVSADRRTETGYIVVEYLTGPDVESEIFFESIGKPFDSGLEQAVLSSVASRFAQG